MKKLMLILSLSFMLAGEMEIDGTLNVIDVVNLVQIVLNR